MRALFEPRNLLMPAVGVVLASFISACGGGANSTASPTLPQTAVPPGAISAAGTRAIAAVESSGLQPAPAPVSTEFFTGITPSSEPHGIRRGSSGFWFTQANASQVGHITASGAVTEHSGLSANAQQIVEGSDGNMWFTETTDTIGRLKPGGKVTEFAVGTAAFGPFDITSGADGNLWFTFRTPADGGYTDAIGRITTSGAVTLFTNGLTTGDPAVHDITLGPDGNVWFTEEFANKIGRITTSGVITEFSIGITPNANLVDITAGPDGNVWFTEYGANRIGRITPAGVVTEFSKGISAGPEPARLRWRAATCGSPKRVPAASVA